MGVRDSLKHAWNAFTTNEANRTEPMASEFRGGFSSGGRPDQLRMRVTNERSIIASIYTRIAIDFASIDIRHVRVDEDGRYVEDIKSGIHDCLNVEANIDQAASHFKRDWVLSLFDHGTIAVVPIVTTGIPNGNGAYDISDMRVGKIVSWGPRHVRVEAYDDRPGEGRRKEIVVPKRDVAITENPLYMVMNEPNSTLRRLTHKLSLLDAVDDQSASGKLDLIVQLPYVVKTESKRQQAEQRRKDIEFQLAGSKYGIAYTDGTEKITQLNRPVENNLMKQVEYLTQMLYGQLGLTEEIMNGTATEEAMLNYINRTLEPLLDAFVEEFRRKFLSKTARSQGQSFLYFRDAFKLVPMSQLAEMADKFTRNEIFTTNEIRQFIGQRPSKDPKADQLRNSNMPAPVDVPTDAPPTPDAPADTPASGVDGAALEADPYAGINDTLDQIFSDLGVDG